MDNFNAASIDLYWDESMGTNGEVVLPLESEGYREAPDAMNFDIGYGNNPQNFE
jgi:hypothetical protein